ncbi:hypothetical protein D3C80_1516030 [compost metagenome]
MALYTTKLISPSCSLHFKFNTYKVWIAIFNMVYSATRDPLENIYARNTIHSKYY